VRGRTIAVLAGDQTGQELLLEALRVLDPAVIGLPKGTHFHELRHFYASTLIHAGLHPKEIQVRLGHASITETMDTYGHLFPDSEESGRGAIQGAFSEILADSLRTEAILN